VSQGGTVLVDSNVLLDVVTDDPMWFAWSSSALAEAADSSRLAINPIVYAEVSVGFDRIEELDEALPDQVFARLALPWSAGFLSGKCFLAYVEQRELETFVDKDNLESVTANTITDWAEFREELETTRQRGFALVLQLLAKPRQQLGGHVGLLMAPWRADAPARTPCAGVCDSPACRSASC
jgi:hypothetical protein